MQMEKSEQTESFYERKIMTALYHLHKESEMDYTTGVPFDVMIPGVGATVYTPDFILNDLKKDEKYIAIEVHSVIYFDKRFVNKLKYFREDNPEWYLILITEPRHWGGKGTANPMENNLRELNLSIGSICDQLWHIEPPRHSRGYGGYVYGTAPMGENLRPDPEVVNRFRAFKKSCDAPDAHLSNIRRG